MDEGSESLVNLLGKRPGKSRRMGSSRRHQRGAGNPEGIERLVEEDNLSNAGQEKGAGAGEAPPQNSAEHQSKLLLPSMEIDIQQSQVQTECKTESENLRVSLAHRHESESVEKSGVSRSPDEISENLGKYREHPNVDEAQETSLSNRRGRRRKLGPTRKSSRKAEVQTEVDVIGQERKQREYSSDNSEQAEQSTFLMGMEYKEERQEDSVIEQAGSSHTPHMSDYSGQAHHTTFIREETHTDTQLTQARTESVGCSVAENLIEESDQLNKLEGSLRLDKGSALNLNFNDFEQRSVDLEDPAQKSEEGDMSNVEDHSSEEVSKGEVLFSLAEENGQEEIKENKEREEERNPEKGQTVVSDGHSPTILEQSHNSTAAEQVETAKLQDTQLPLIMENTPIRCEGEISVQEGGKLGKTDQRGAETDTTDKSADIMVYEDTTLPQETSLPVPNKRERRRKLGSTRKCSRKAEVQIETGLEEDTMGQEIEEGEEPSLLEEPLGFEPAAPLGEIQAAKQTETMICQTTDQNNRMDCQIGVKKASGISTQTPETSDNSEQAEQSTFLMGMEYKEERQEHSVIEQAESSHTPHMSDYSGQAHHTTFIREETHTDTQLTQARTESVGCSVAENLIEESDQLNKLEDSLRLDKGSALSLNLNDFEQRSVDLEDPAQKSEEGDMSNVEDHSSEEVSKGEVLFSLDEENGQEKIKENKEREEERNPEKGQTVVNDGHSPTILEPSHNSTAAEQVETAKLQDTQLPLIMENTPIRCEGEISVQEGGKLGETDQRGAETDTTDKSADIMVYEDTTLPQETSLPVPNKRERRRKLGSTRKCSRKAEVQIETGLEEDTMGQEIEEGEEPSLLEEPLGFEPAAPLGEIQAAKQTETMICQTTDQNNRMDCQIGVKKASGISTQTPETSDNSEQAEQSTFLMGMEYKEERQEHSVIEQAGSSHTPHMSDYSGQAHHTTFIREETHTDTQLTQARTESVRCSVAENLIEESDQLNKLEGSLRLDKGSALSLNLNDFEQRSVDLEDPAQKSEEGDMSNVEDHSSEEVSKGEVLFSLDEENGQEKIKENKEREEERNPEKGQTVVSDGHSPTILEPSHNSTAAEQVETAKLQDTQLPLIMENMPIRCEGEISVQEGGKLGETDQRGAETDTTDKSADIMVYEDTTLPQETSLPVPNKRERRRKLGSTRKCSRKAEVQIETGLEEDTMGQEIEEGEEPSLLEEPLGFEPAAPLGEIQAAKQTETMICQTTDQNNRMDCQIGVKKATGISTQTPETSDNSEQAEQSTFLMGMEYKEERQEDSVIEQAGSSHTPHMSDYSGQAHHTTFIREETHTDTQLTQARTESVRCSVAENLIEESDQLKGIFSLDEENGHEKIKENKEREEERNPEKGQTVVSDGHSPTILEPSHNSTAAEQVETAKLQDTQLPLIMENTPIRCEGEISVQEGGKLGETDQRGAETDTTDKSADIMVYEDTTLPQETSLPVPNKRERRRKLGSTRKCSRKAEVQIETGLEEDTMGQEIEEGEEPSLLEEPLGFEPAAPLGEIQAEKQKEKSIHYATDHEKGMECQAGDRENSDISTHKPEASDHSQLVEPSTFVKDWEIDTDTQLTLWSRESVGHSVAENTKHENLVEDTVILDQLNQSEDSLLPDKGSALSLNLNDSQQRTPELEDHPQKSGGGEMMNKEHSTGDVLFILAEESGHEKIKENTEGEVVSDGHSSTIFEQSDNSSNAEQAETLKLQGTQLPLVTENMPFKHEGEIKAQERGDQAQTDERTINLAEKDRCTNTVKVKDTALPLEMRHPVPTRREKKRKLGSTRRSSRRAEGQTEAVMGEEGEKGEESSKLEDDSGTSVPSEEIQAENQKEKSIHQSTEHSTFSVEKEEKEEREQQEMEVGMYHTPDISDNCVQSTHSAFAKEMESIPNTQTTHREGVGSSVTEITKHENMIQDTALIDQLNPPGGNLHTEKNCDLSVSLHDSQWRSQELTGNTQQFYQPKNIGQFSADEHNTSTIPPRRRKMGSTRKGLQHSPIQGEREKCSKQREKSQGDEGEMGQMLEGNYLNGSHKQERGIDKKKDGAILSSVQSLAFLEPTQCPAITGKQDKASTVATQPPAVRKKLGSSCKDRRSVWKGERDLRQADLEVEDPKASAVLQRIKEIFQHWDPEEKGFITWDQMQGLGGELGLSTEELWQVFDRLDKDREGLVTSEDVTAGFRDFMQFQQPRARPAAEAPILPEELDDNGEKTFLSMLDDLRAYSLLQEHIQQHSVGVEELHEEMERQIGTEKIRVKKESLEKSRSQLAKVEEELDHRNREIQALNVVQNQLEDSVRRLRQQQSGAEEQERCRDLEQQLESIRGQLQETLSHVHALHSDYGHKQPHPQLRSLMDRGGQIEDFSRPESEMRDSSYQAVVQEGSGSVLDHWSPQDSCIGAQGDSHRRVISIEEDPMPDLPTGSQASPHCSLGEALWDKQRGQARGERDSLSSVSCSPAVLDLLYNVVLLGNSSVGKTCFMRRFQSGEFSPDLCATVGLDSCIQSVQVEGRRVILQVWDTAGQERYHSVTKQILRKAQGLLLMYDITSSQSFLALRYWLSSIQEGAPDNVIIMLLGNKNDSSKQREVSLEEGQRLAREYNIHFMECSVATGNNVAPAMNNLARMLKQQVDDKQEGSVTFQNGSPKKKSGCCG